MQYDKVKISPAIFNDFTLPRTVVNKIDAINVVIGAEDFGKLIELTLKSHY
jgi:hypothetical protein